MKIAYCAHSKVPSREANSIHVMKMCQALANLGNDVELIVPNLQVDPSDPYDFYGVKKIFKIKYINYPRRKFGVLFYSHNVLKYLKQNKKNVVYGRDLTTCFFSILSGIPTIWESHAPVDYMGKIYVWFFKRMCRKKSFLKLVVITSTLKKFYEEKYGIPSERIAVLPDCSDIVDLKKVYPIRIENKGCKANVGYIGQLYTGKGMEILSQLIPICPDVMFHIIGGNDKEVCFWSDKLKTYKNVTFYGFMKPSETISYGLAMDILIAPYMRKVHGVRVTRRGSDLSNWMSPLKLFEYMSFKKPIVSSDIPVLHDILNSNNAILCNPDDISEWADAIYSIVNNPHVAEKMANNAYNDFCHNYTWDIRAKKIVDYLTN